MKDPKEMLGGKRPYERMVRNKFRKRGGKNKEYWQGMVLLTHLALTRSRTETIAVALRQKRKNGLGRVSLTKSDLRPFGHAKIMLPTPLKQFL